MTTTSDFTDFTSNSVVEAYRLDRYDNLKTLPERGGDPVVEAYRLDRYDNLLLMPSAEMVKRCSSLSFG